MTAARRLTADVNAARAVETDSLPRYLDEVTANRLLEPLIQRHLLPLIGQFCLGQRGE